MLARLLAAPSPLRTRRGIDLDFPLLAGCLALLGLGLVMITSASSEVAAAMSGNPLYHMIRHLIYLGLGISAALLTLLIPMAMWQRFGATLLLVAFVLLILVLLPGIGREVNGAKRWIGFGMFNVQPSELAKLFTVVFIAGYLVRRQEEVREKLSGFLKPMLVLAPMAALLLAEPDFGATVVLVGSCIAMLFLGGINLVRFIPLAAAVLGAGVLVMTAQSYRMERLTNFVDPWADQFGAGYQLSQALIAFGRGEWFGVGLGNSVQKQFYLPEAHTDFVFAVLAEELGMVGALVTVGLFVFVAVRALYIGLWAEKAKQLFSAYVAYGIAMQWIGQVLINIGVNVGLLPTKGLTLPFLSYGGSSLIICCVSLAMLLRIEWERRTSLGSEEVEFSEADFFDNEEVKHAR
ncbi:MULTISPECIES: putative lipid II flippase FtsW [unclassified Pseudomonas]|uniref:putative lipid II flippase FtsW n=1 Tax=unclassified Pseudomonas TaxID=196821 RepID=UPI00244BEC14|nr:MULTISPECIES: putative lipid II flippase FtsW [unclassified Pseudomonas]MDG9929905.1 putative lipid II flippase FtsW [Pseudomonas sp. GD04042]MDH0485044.1 putative lipid II flippase FtsW [Pseudomonas sp. GD04015]MDH0606392.1 putative lipid II flippase FtsW [Pseudomonas sp. GD03869]MDH0896798.1 putative lipid II flippase FtsW [Pseudomonas sp. GD03875]MDH1066549.1 putative lipid II flippase FtsW [Pseudomonas sp. GD03985]